MLYLIGTNLSSAPTQLPLIGRRQILEALIDRINTEENLVMRRDINIANRIGCNVTREYEAMGA